MAVVTTVVTTSSVRRDGCLVSHIVPFRFKYTYMEEQLTNAAGARQIFERWMEWHPDEECWFAYVNFEMRYGEVDKVSACG